MKYKNYSVYDNKDFFEKYIQKRSLGHSPNETIEQPVMDELIANVTGLKILDLGCGDGKYGLELLKRGAAHYHGIEGSENMAQLAQTHLQTAQSYIEVGDIEKTALKKETYDLVISRLVFHYIEDLQLLMDRIAMSLKEGGACIFSIEHPIITSCYDAYHKEVKRGNWIVDDYFDSGERVNTWMGKEVLKYHKTLEEYWAIMNRANFQVESIRESKPIASYFEKEEDYERRKRIPLFLFFKLKKN